MLDGHIGPAAFERAQGAAQKVQLLVAADDDRRAVVPKLPQQKGGDSAEDAGNMLIYRGDGQMGTAEGAALCFEMQGDTVAAIFLTLEAI